MCSLSVACSNVHTQILSQICSLNDVSQFYVIRLYKPIYIDV
jgi:hypothetical protein